MGASKSNQKKTPMLNRTALQRKIESFYVR
jgi:hypothetical protein